jgi:hypothetical protein
MRLSHAVIAASHPLPEPDAAWTIPIAILLAVFALFALVRKLIFLAVVAVAAAALFFAYQGGAFDSWVDKGKSVVDDQNPLNRTTS